MCSVRVTYLVLVHQESAQLGLLLDALLVDGDDRALVHVDAKANQRPFQTAARRHGDRVRFVKRTRNVRWGDFSAVQVVSDSLREAVESFTGDYYVVVSGADYPIKPVPELRKELESNSAVYMECVEMPSEEHDKPLSRLDHYFLAFKNRNSRVAYRINDRLLRHWPKRDIDRGLRGITPYAGASWWAAPHRCAVQMLEFMDRTPHLKRFFRYSQCPDEMFFQTVLKALSEDWPTRPPLTYADWTRRESNGRSPATLDSTDVDRLAAVPEFFARKFDLRRDPDVYAKIDEQLIMRTGGARG